MVEAALVSEAANEGWVQILPCCLSTVFLAAFRNSITQLRNDFLEVYLQGKVEKGELPIKVSQQVFTMLFEHSAEFSHK